MSHTWPIDDNAGSRAGLDAGPTLDEVIGIACALADHDALGSVHLRTHRLSPDELHVYREQLAPHGMTLMLDDAGVVIQPLPPSPQPSGIASVVSRAKRLVKGAGDQPSARRR